ncbi:MAG TPA: glycosyltransferase family 2 protein [Candidatus Limnocylindrales bacterium]|nr:glycosyltransferase family 2 protein [Candidatus Limnocylindrales bacterium]
MADSQTLVSVVIPVFNGEGTIRRGIESIFNQTHPNIEIVVVDDCSKDSTREILKSFGSRINAIFHPKNRGTAGAYNTGSQAAKGRFLLLMASDCYLTQSDYIERGLQHFADPTVAGVIGQGIFDNPDRLDTIQRIFTLVNVLDVVEQHDEDVFEVAFIETRCDLVRKEALEKIGFWFEGLYNSTEDQDISAHMREFGYRLLQDKRMKFSLDFGQTEDNLYKVFKKQYKYAHGQGYIFLRYGLGHHTMTGDQHNRRIRIRHRLIQIAMAPLVPLLLLLSTMSPTAGLLLGVIVVARGAHYWNCARGLLTGMNRLVGAIVGIGCDVTYGTSFLTSLVYWALKDRSIVRFGKPAPSQPARP